MRLKYSEHFRTGGVNRFEFAAGQYTWTANKAIMGTANPGMTFVRTTPGSGFNLYQPPLNGQVDSLTAPPGQIYLKLAGNNPNSDNPAYIVSASGVYGARIFSARVNNEGGAQFPLVPLGLRFKLGAAPYTFVAYFLPVTVPDTELAPPQLAVSLMDTVINHYSVENSGIILGLSIKVKLTALFEGKYNSNDNIMSKRDTVRLYLRRAVSPFEIVDSSKGVIDSVNFSNVFSFFSTLNGNYYLVVKHKQCIETWSKFGGENLVRDTSIYNYNFTTSSSQAFRNNMKLKGTKYCLYSGDVDQNGIINLTDAILIYNDAFNFEYGNAVNDLNGDNIVDLNDILIVNSNMNSFIKVWTP